VSESVSVLAALVALLAPLALATLRLVPATMMLPLLGGRVMPTSAKTPILAVLALGAAPSLLDQRAPAALRATLVLAVLRELWLGIMLALVLSMPFFAVEHAGRLLDQTRGASTSELTAPDGMGRGTPLSELFRWSFGTVFVASGGLRALIACVAQSFVRYPVDVSPSAIAPLDGMVFTATRWAADSLSAGLALAGSGLLALFAAEASLAVAARVAPPVAQSNMAAPTRAIVVLFVLALTVHVMSDAGLSLARSALEAAHAL
jgi:type III secretory pathway component EscT